MTSDSCICINTTIVRPTLLHSVPTSVTKFRVTISIAQLHILDITLKMAAVNPTPIRLAQTIGITTAGILGGMNLTLSAYQIPTLLLSPAALALRQFDQVYTLGKKAGPSLSLVSFGSFIYLAYDSYMRFADTAVLHSPLRNQWKGYAVAAGLALGILPYTVVLMAGGVNKKLREAAKGKKGDDVDDMGVEEVRKTLVKWARFNYGRAALGVSATAVATWTAMA